MESLEKHGGRFLEAIADYVETSIELTALRGADKSSRLASGFFTIVILTIVFLLFLNMISIGIAILLAYTFHHLWVGFVVVGFVYLVIGVILYLFRKKIIFDPLLNSILAALTGGALKAEEKIEELQDKIEDKLNLEKQPDN